MSWNQVKAVVIGVSKLLIELELNSFKATTTTSTQGNNAHVQNFKTIPHKSTLTQGTYQITIKRFFTITGVSYTSSITGHAMLAYSKFPHSENSMSVHVCQTTTFVSCHVLLWSYTVCFIKFFITAVMVIQRERTKYDTEALANCRFNAVHSTRGESVLNLREQWNNMIETYEDVFVSFTLTAGVVRF